VRASAARSAYADGKRDEAATEDNDDWDHDHCRNSAETIKDGVSISAGAAIPLALAPIPPDLDEIGDRENDTPFGACGVDWATQTADA